MTVVGDTTKEAPEVAESTNVATDSKPEEAKEKEGVFDDFNAPTMAPVGDEAGDVEDLARIPGRLSNPVLDRVKINGDQYSEMDLMISPEEKSAFVDAMITGARYTHRFSLFGGRVSVLVRSRTAAETHAMYSYIRYTLAEKEGENVYSRIEGDMAYIPLVAQIAEVNGTAYPEMKGPLTFEESGGKVVEPGWYEDFKAWKAKPEGLTSALISCVQLFEYKYWTMTKEATNKNFWSSDTSSEG